HWFPCLSRGLPNPGRGPIYPDGISLPSTKATYLTATNIIVNALGTKPCALSRLESDRAPRCLGGVPLTDARNEDAIPQSALARIWLRRVRSVVRRHRIFSVDRVGHLKSVHMTKAPRRSGACGATG